MDVEQDSAPVTEDPMVRLPKQKSSIVSGSGFGSSKKKSPKIPQKSQSSLEVSIPEVTKQTEGKKLSRDKRINKEKKTHHSSQHVSTAPEEDQAGNKCKSGSDKPHRTRTRQGPQRQSIRRQSQVEYSHDHGVTSVRNSKISEEMPTAGGGVISVADLSDVFEEKGQYYHEESDVKQLEDKSNCCNN